MDLTATMNTITATSMTMDIHTTMITDRMHTDTPGLLQLIWLASPALPIGGFRIQKVWSRPLTMAGCMTKPVPQIGLPISCTWRKRVAIWPSRRRRCKLGLPAEHRKPQHA